MRRLSAILTITVLIGCVASAESARLSSRADLSRLLDSTVHDWRFKLWETPGAEKAGFDDSAWETVDVGYRWWPSESTCWFRKVITVPETVNGVTTAGANLHLRFAIDNEADVYVDGALRGHFKRDEGDAPLSEHAVPGQRVVVAIHGINHPGYGSLYQAFLENQTAKPAIDALKRLSKAFDRAESDAPYTPKAEAAHWQKLIRQSIQALDMPAYRSGDTRVFLESMARAQAALVSDLSAQESRSHATTGALARLTRAISRGRARGLQMAYDGVDARVVESFIQYARDDMGEKDLERQIRGVKIAHYIQRLVNDAAREANKAATHNPAGEPRVPTYHTGPIETRDGAFWQDGRPIFFTGVGHFGQVRQDTPILNDYGLNIIQIEMGPSNAMPRPGEVDREAIRRNVVAALDNAAKHNVMVNLLVSPHYFPQWAIDRDPKLGECGTGFLHFCIEAPEARAIVETYLRALLPIIKDHPALHSICLSNEPQYTGKCAYSVEGFHAWLKRRHGSVDGLNATYGSHYGSFEAIPIPDTAADYPLYYDFCRYNQDRFLAFHAFERDIIREYAPALPVHVKVMSLAFGDPGRFTSGINHEDFNSLGAIAGNDCVQNFAQPEDVYAQEWQTMAMNYTLQHVTAPGAPIYNSEDHIIADGELRYIPGSHIRTAFYTQALHGQGAATTWVWERQQGGDFRENILTRPTCVRELGRIALDLNRLASEMTVLQKAPADVAILYSMSAMAASADHTREAEAVFTALYFGDTVADFVTERQCVSGKLSAYKVLVVPHAANVPTNTALHIQDFVKAGGTVIQVGECFTHDEYGHATAAPVMRVGSGSVVNLAGGQKPEAYRDALLPALAAAHCSRPAVLNDGQGQPIWGVNLRTVPYQGKLLASLVNFSKRPCRINLDVVAGKASAINLLTRKPVRFPMTIQPLDPVLLCLTPSRG